MAPRQVVIVGYGSAGARLQEELHRHDPQQQRIRSVVYGKEATRSYNRIQLPDILAGRLAPNETYLRPPGWCERRGLKIRLGVWVTGIDRRARMVWCSDGSTCDYDTLVIATGSRPFIPPIRGVRDDTGGLLPGVVPFRTLHDCDALARRIGTGTRVVVVGAGLVGLEAARAAQLRGAHVTVVHPEDFPMERNIDAAGGWILARVLREMGVAVVFGRSVTQIAASQEGRHTVGLDSGQSLAADVVVLAAGIRPECTLAQQAGLCIDDAIVVDDKLATSDPNIRAIGECVQHRGQVYGLVQPGWQMADVLAKQLSGADPDAVYTGTRQITRLKADGIDLLTMGDVDVPSDDLEREVLTIADPTRGRYGKVVIRDDRLVGAVSLQNPDTTGLLSQLFDSQSTVPSDRMSLLLGHAYAQTAQTRPEDLPDTAVICRCNTVTKNQIVDSWTAGHRTLQAVIDHTRATTGCGSCADTVHALCTRLSRAA